jgi:hypothetical protein
MDRLELSRHALIIQLMCSWWNKFTIMSLQTTQHLK